MSQSWFREGLVPCPYAEELHDGKLQLPNAQPDLPEDVLPEQIIILKNANTNSLEGLFHVRFV